MSNSNISQSHNARQGIRIPWLFLAVVLLLVVFIVLLLIPQEDVPFMFSKDYLNHGGVFFCLTLFLWFAFASRWWLQLAVLVFLAIATEYIQELVPYRHFAWEDLLSNLAGIGLAAAFIGLIKLVNILIDRLHD